MLGFSCGFYSGAFFFFVVCWYTEGKYSEVWLYYLLAVFFGLTGAIRGIQRGKLVVMVYSSIVGSYLIMRGLALYYPGDYPNDYKWLFTQSQADIEIGPNYWQYIVIFLLVNWVSFVF